MPVYKPPIAGAEPPIAKTPPSVFSNVIRPSPPSFPGEQTPQWVAVELPPSLMSQIMEQVSLGKEVVTMTPEMFKDIWEMTHPGPWTPLSPTSRPPIEHGPVKGPESPPGKVVSVPVLPPGKEHEPVGGGGSTTPPRERPIPIPPPIHHGPVPIPPIHPPSPPRSPLPVGPIGVPLPPGAANEWEEIIKREIEHRGPPIWLPMMGGSLAPVPPTANPPRPPIELPTPIWGAPNEPWEFWNPPIIRGRRIPIPVPP
jgi:hypothetical protein